MGEACPELFALRSSLFTKFIRNVLMQFVVMDLEWNNAYSKKANGYINAKNTHNS